MDRASTSGETGIPPSLKRAFKLLNLGLLPCLILFFISPLSAKSWHITDFHDTIAIGQDGNAVVTERINLQFRAEAFNLFNHPNFNLPDNFLGSPTFGRISSARDPRHIQFGLKLLF